ncbi:uncharacterized protein [Nicotiana sylvestris]|uniref:uncharacterized protein n=1 Tax=Nicotiana sylvestris TaxID=4096 RepID=UPI00388CAACB
MALVSEGKIVIDMDETAEANYASIALKEKKCSRLQNVSSIAFLQFGSFEPVAVDLPRTNFEGLLELDTQFKDKDDEVPKAITLYEFFPGKFLHGGHVGATHIFSSSDETKEINDELAPMKTQEHHDNKKVVTCCATIFFTDDDLLLGSKPHNRPLFIVGAIREQYLNRILVDDDSAINIMPKMVLKKLRISIYEPSKNAKTSYNLLPGRPWIHENGVVSSTLHQCLKYRRDGEIVKIDIDINPLAETESYFADANFYLDSWSYEVKKEDLFSHHQYASGLLEGFDQVFLNHVPREENCKANALADLAMMMPLRENESIKVYVCHRWVIPTLLDLQINKDSPLKMQRRTIVYTCQPRKEAEKEKEVIQGSQREKSDFMETSYHITVEDSPCLDVNDKVHEAPLQLKVGGQSTVNELKELNLGTPKDPLPTFISVLLMPQEEEEYSKLLTEYKDVFAWSYKEMSGLSPKVVVHHLGIKSGAHPVKQSQCMFRPEMVPQIEVKVNKLIKAGFIREVKYPSWIPNIVPIKKKNGQMRVCVDFRDLNKACPKDDFSLLIIELMVDATNWSYEVKKEDLFSHHQYASGLLEIFDQMFLNHVPREENCKANALADLAMMMPLRENKSIKVYVCHRWVIPTLLDLQINESHHTSVRVIEEEDWRQPLIEYLGHGKLSEDPQ